MVTPKTKLAKHTRPHVNGRACCHAGRETKQTTEGGKANQRQAKIGTNQERSSTSLSMCRPPLPASLLRHKVVCVRRVIVQCAFRIKANFLGQTV